MKNKRAQLRAAKMMATSKTGSCSVKGISTAAAMKKIAIRIEPRQELNEKDISFPIKRPSITAKKAALKIMSFFVLSKMGIQNRIEGRDVWGLTISRNFFKL